MRSISPLFLVPCLLLASSTALADGPANRDKSNSQFRLRHGEIAGGAGEIGRQHARAGDCAGALDYFDRAVSASTDPTLQRDRGLCHDKLNQPFPAIDDYRAYLSARPDSPDSDQIRERLGALEQANNISPENNKGVDADKPGADTSSQNQQLDAMIKDERLQDAAETSPLRLASGGVIGAYFGLRRYVGNGTSSDLGFQVGATFRYSVGRHFSLVGEFGYAQMGSEDNSAGGPGLFLGGELRFPISKNMSDAFLIGAGPGYERYSNNDLTDSVILVLGRLGYRHVFGPNFGFELTAQGGYTNTSFVGINEPSVSGGIIGLQTGLTLGF